MAFNTPASEVRPYYRSGVLVHPIGCLCTSCKETRWFTHIKEEQRAADLQAAKDQRAADKAQRLIERLARECQSDAHRTQRALRQTWETGKVVNATPYQPSGRAPRKTATEVKKAVQAPSWAYVNLFWLLVFAAIAALTTLPHCH